MSLPFPVDTSTQLTYSTFGFATPPLDNYATSNFVSNVSNVLRTAINTKQDTLTAATNLLGVGTSITAIDYNKVSVNKPTNFQADWNSTIINKPSTFPVDTTVYYNKTETNNLLNAKQASISTYTITGATGGSFGFSTGTLTIGMPTNYTASMSLSNLITPTSFIYKGTELSTTLATKQNNLTFSSPLVNTANTITFNESAITTLTNFYNKTEANARYLQLTGGTLTGSLNITSLNQVLDFGARGQDNIIKLWSSGTDIYGFGINNSTLRYNVPATATHRFYTGTTNTVTIDGSGNVGIGITNPFGSLSIGTPAAVSDGTLTISKNYSAGGFRNFKIGLDASFNFCIGDFGNAVSGNTWSSNHLTINWQTGNIGIGISGQSQKLYVNGSVYITAATTINAALTATSFSGDGANITNVPYSTIAGKPTNFQADWNTTIINKPSTFPVDTTIYYNKTEVNNLLNAKQASISTYTITGATGGSFGFSTGTLTLGMPTNYTANMSLSNLITPTSFIYQGTELSTTLATKQNNLTFSSPLVNTTNTITFNESVITTLTNFYNKTEANARYLQLTGGTMTGNLGIGINTPQYKLHITAGKTTASTAYAMKISGGVAQDGGNFGTLIGITSEDSAFCKNAIGHVRTATYDRGDIVFLCNNTADGSSASMSDEKMRIEADGNVGIGTTNPLCRLQVNGIVNITNTSPYATANNKMQSGSLTIGDTLLNYGGGNNWTTNTAGLMLECSNNTEIAVHDTGDRIASLMYYSGNTITIGRDMGWNAISSVTMNGNSITTGYVYAGGTTTGLRINGNDYGNTIYQDAITISGAAADIGFTLRNTNSFVFKSLTSPNYIEICRMNTSGISVFGNLIYNYLFNNTGGNHGDLNNFDNVSHFGYKFIQGNINSPSTAFSQYYSWYIGLGINYPATGTNSHGCQFALPRDTVHPYLSVRFRENNVWRGWTGIYASKAAVADTLATGNQTVYGQFTCGLYTIANTNRDLVGVNIENTNTGNYNTTTLYVIQGTFTGFHRCFTEDELFDKEDPQLFKDNYEGRIVISTGKIATDTNENNRDWEIKYDKDGITIEDALPQIELSRKKKDKRVFGVLGDKRRGNSRKERMIVNSVGEGGIWVCNSNGNIENGDYITSSDYLGYGEKQDDDLLHNYTVAKATMDCSFELDSPLYNCIEIQEGLRIAFIAATYHCG